MNRIKFEEEELSVIRDLIVNSIKTRVKKAGAKGGIVALSGGVDSSLVCKLAHLALGNSLHFLIMPEREVTPEQDLNDAKKLSEELKVPYSVIDITELISPYKKLLSDISENKSDYSLVNVKPRVRMILNYLWANSLNYIVIGTSNKTELLLGYGTKFGDLGADIYPIGDLYKTQIWQLAEFIGIPTEIVKKVPSAGLWVGQTDEQELGQTYEQIDKILFCLVDMELSIKETSELLKIPEESVYDLYTRIERNEHKRRPPTITKISRMCLDKDWRYPVERF